MAGGGCSILIRGGAFGTRVADARTIRLDLWQPGATPAQTAKSSPVSRPRPSLRGRFAAVVFHGELGAGVESPPAPGPIVSTRTTLSLCCMPRGGADLPPPDRERYCLGCANVPRGLATQPARATRRTSRGAWHTYITAPLPRDASDIRVPAPAPPVEVGPRRPCPNRASTYRPRAGSATTVPPHCVPVRASGSCTPRFDALRSEQVRPPWPCPLGTVGADLRGPAERWRIGTIAAQLGLHRDTVAACSPNPACQHGRCNALGPIDPYLPFLHDARAVSASRPRGCTPWCANAVTPGAPITSATSSPTAPPARSAEAYLRFLRRYRQQAQVDWGTSNILTIGRAPSA